MKKYEKFMIATAILFVPMLALIYLKQSSSIIALAVFCSALLVAILYSDIIERLSIGVNGASLVLKKAQVIMEKANATIEMLEKAQEPILTYSLELMYSEGMTFSSSMESKIEAFKGIKKFINHSQTYDSRFDKKLKHAIFGVNESAYSDLHRVFDNYINENNDRIRDELSLSEYEMSNRNFEKSHQISSYFIKSKEDGYLKETVNFSGLIKFGEDELSGDYKADWDAIIFKLKEFCEENKY